MVEAEGVCREHSCPLQATMGTAQALQAPHYHHLWSSDAVFVLFLLIPALAQVPAFSLLLTLSVPFSHPCLRTASYTHCLLPASCPPEQEPRTSLPAFLEPLVALSGIGFFPCPFSSPHPIAGPLAPRKPSFLPSSSPSKDLRATKDWPCCGPPGDCGT